MKYLKLFEDYSKHCPVIKLTDEIIEEINLYNTDEELLRNGGLSIEALDRAAYGFSSDDIKTLLPKQLNIKWKEDYEGVLFEVEYFAKKNNLSFDKAKLIWSLKVNLSEPIEVCYEKDKFWIEDGHHRYFATKTLKKSLNVDLIIKQNSITKLGGDLGYDDFHRCIFKQVKNKRITENLFNSKYKSHDFDEIAEEFCEKNNYVFSHHFDNGNNGHVYIVKKNNISLVLKLTTSYYEYLSSKKIKGIESEYFAYIYEVKDLSNDYENLYCIVLELLDSLTDEYYNLSDIKIFNNKEKYIKDNLKYTPNEKFIADYYDRVLKIKNEYEKYNINPSDIIITNMGMKNGKIATFDIEDVYDINLSKITESIDDYSKWKRNNITYRGIRQFGEENGVSGMLGNGLYSVPLSNKSMAKSYGDLYFVYNAKPKNSKIFQSLNAWEIWSQTILMRDYQKDGFPDRRLFDKSTNIEKEVIKLGYDGIIIKGREMVNYSPIDVKYFKTEYELKNFYDSLN